MARIGDVKPYGRIDKVKGFKPPNMSFKPIDHNVGNIFDIGPKKRTTRGGRTEMSMQSSVTIYDPEAEMRRRRYLAAKRNYNEAVLRCITIKMFKFFIQRPFEVIRAVIIKKYRHSLNWKHYLSIAGLIGPVGLGIHYSTLHGFGIPYVGEYVNPAVFNGDWITMSFLYLISEVIAICVVYWINIEIGG